MLDKLIIKHVFLFDSYYDYKSLLASEVVQLLCIVPAFFQYVAKDVGKERFYQN